MDSNKKLMKIISKRILKKKIEKRCNKNILKLIKNNNNIKKILVLKKSGKKTIETIINQLRFMTLIFQLKTI